MKKVSRRRRRKHTRNPKQFLKSKSLVGMTIVNFSDKITSMINFVVVSEMSIDHSYRALFTHINDHLLRIHTTHVEPILIFPIRSS